MLFRQIAVLVWKQWLLSLVRAPVTTILRAFVLPIVFTFFISFSKNFFVPYAVFGIGEFSTPIRSISETLSEINSGRSLVAFVRNGYTGGSIDLVITNITRQVDDAGYRTIITDNPDDLYSICPSSLAGGTECVVALNFHSSPDEPTPGGIWNYTIILDGALGAHPDVTSNRGDQQLYALPFQHGVDWAIAGLNTTVDQAALPSVVEYPYTSESADERAERIRRLFAGTAIDILAVAFFIGICGVSYQQVGAQALETETGMSKLLETMAPNKRRWEPQVARLTSYWLAFAVLYFPGWFLMGLIIKALVFTSSNVGILIIYHILIGFALCSQALFIGAFFRKAQLSGITAILANLILAIIAQVFNQESNSAVAALSLFFPSMNYVYFIMFMARWERNNWPANLSESAPNSPWTLSGGVFFILLIIQIVLYPIAGAILEKALWGTASTQSRRKVTDENVAVELRGFTKVFRQNRLSAFFARMFGQKPREDVVAVNSLDLKVLRGSILVLLGANGSGKSSTLNTVAGLATVSSGTVAVSSPGLGYCPQTNVLWPKLTVAEHLSILGRWKAVGKSPTKAERMKLIDECDLSKKVKTLAGALSGGQQRKLQLALCFISGSPVTLIDEVSSGIDPLARRKIQDIILAERLRSNRSVIFTTHFLDEAEAVGDHIAILSKGVLKTSGSVPELKQSAGGYRIMIQKLPGIPEIPVLEDAKRTETRDEVIYEAPSPARAAEMLSHLEEMGHKTSIHGPSLEDIFMAVAEEMSLEAIATTPSDGSEVIVNEPKEPNARTFAFESTKPLSLEPGEPVGPLKQYWYLFEKRLSVFKRNPLPNLAALVLPVIAGGLVLLFLNGFDKAGCTPDDRVSQDADINFGSLTNDVTFEVLAGPQDRVGLNSVSLLEASLGLGAGGADSGSSNDSDSSLNLTTFTNSIHFVSTLTGFNDYIRDNYHNVTPGGFFFGPDNIVTLTYVANDGLAAPILMQNLVDTLATNISIVTQYNTFAVPWQANQGKSLQFVLYFGLVMSITTAFFSLYPTAERLRKVRQHQYSNGVRPTALWPSYLTFDLIFVTVGVSVAVALFAGVNSGVFFDLGLFWVVLFAYGLTGTLVAYAASLFASGQLAAFAVSAAFGALALLLYILAYLLIATYAPTLRMNEYQEYAYFTMAIILPAASLLRSIFVSLNVLNINCRGVSEYASNGNEMLAYGGPITYLIIQAMVLLAFLIWWDYGQRFIGLFALFRRGSKTTDQEGQYTPEPEIQAEVRRAESAANDGLTVLHLTKKYGRFVAVDDISFGVEKGTIFALLGPNGGGKTSTISTISGDSRPTSGTISIDNIPLLKNRAEALQRLGLCPQFDALDVLTVTETLCFYAKIRGIKHVESNVVEIIRAVGLVKFKDRLALTLSGGNKRRLSLAIALLGNPALVLLDEPSSGMDIAAKRIMWATLRRVSAGRSMVLVTHSMEEADALATRAGLLAKRFLAFGTTAELRERHGNRYYIHIVLKTAPYTTAAETERIKDWVLQTFEGAEVEARMGHGQLRFTVPANSQPSRTASTAKGADSETTAVDGSAAVMTNSQGGSSSISSVFSTLEEAKNNLGFEYTIAQPTLDQVFLNVVQKHNVDEENHQSAQQSQRVRKRRWFGRKRD